MRLLRLYLTCFSTVSSETLIPGGRREKGREREGGKGKGREGEWKGKGKLDTN